MHEIDHHNCLQINIIVREGMRICGLSIQIYNINYQLYINEQRSVCSPS